jgi:hypothetical protein
MTPKLPYNLTNHLSHHLYDYMTLMLPYNLTKTSAIKRVRKARIIAKFGRERALAA